MDDWITTVTCEDCGKKMAKGAYPEHDCVTRESAADTIERLQRALAEAERERDEARADAARYRILRRKVAIIEHDGILGNAETRFSVFEFLNLPHPTYVAPDAAIELDAAIDREVRAALGGEG